METKIARWTIERPVKTLTRRLKVYGERRDLDALAGLTTLAGIEAVAFNVHGRPTRYAVADSGAARAEVAAETLRRAANARARGLDAPAQPLWSSHLSVTISGDTAVIEGRGYGHGVGLCQYGAETLARQGKDHGEILRWYYPEVELVKAY